MTGPEFIIPHERIEDFQVHLDTTAERADHLEPVLQKIVDKILERELRLFETHGASSGVYWAPLKATTILRKQGSTFKRKRTTIEENRPIPFPSRPLWRYGDLVASLSQRGHPQQRLHVDDSGFELSTTHRSAPFHARGTSRMVARPPLIIPAKHAAEYDQMIFDFIFGNEDA
jgi:hypothetical protein